LAFSHDRLSHFSPIDDNILWRLDADPDLVATDIKNRQDDIIAYQDLFILVPRKNEHIILRLKPLS
jgi:hypothetical protein